MDNIIQAAEKNKDLKTFVKAIRETGLEELLEGPGPYTVLAPNERAFRDLPPGRLDVLLEDEQELTKILRYHVVEGVLDQSDLVGRGNVRTLQGGSLQVQKDGGVHVGKATILESDIECENGICHVIDTVLMP